MSPSVGALALLLAAAMPSDQIGERARAVVSRSAYQTIIPEEPRPLTWDLPPGPVVLILKVLLAAGLLAAAFLAAAWLARRLAPGLRDGEVVDEARMAADLPVFRAGAAEALAATGRYAEAIHTLLLETLTALSGAARLAPSLTSREIVSHAPMPTRARDALRALALAVEITHFGGAEPNEADYRACRERYQAFLETYRSPA
jgi:hypothetical protein